MSEIRDRVKVPDVTSVPRYFKTYRWELVLFIGIPMAFYASFYTVFPLLNKIPVSTYGLGIAMGVELYGQAVMLILLGVSYLFVRRLDREFLPALWGYHVSVDAIAVSAGLALLAYSYIDPVGLLLRMALVPWVIGVLVAPVLGFVALMWFARRLTRFSLKHAFFLVAFSDVYSVMLIHGFPMIGRWAAVLYLGVYMSSLIVMGLLRVWLVGNFEWREESFRKKAIIILIVATIAHQYLVVGLGMLLRWQGSEQNVWTDYDLHEGLLVVMGIAASIAAFLAVCGVVYLLRIRPKTGQGVEGDSPLPALAPTPIE